MTRAQRIIMKELVEDDEQRLHKVRPTGRYKFTDATRYRPSLWVCDSTVLELARAGYLERDPERERTYKATWKAHSELQ